MAGTQPEAHSRISGLANPFHGRETGWLAQKFENALPVECQPLQSNDRGATAQRMAIKRGERRIDRDPMDANMLTVWGGQGSFTNLRCVDRSDEHRDFLVSHSGAAQIAE